MMRILLKRFCLSLITIVFAAGTTYAQTSLKLKFKRSAVYAGIEVGSKGVKMSFIEIANKAQNTGTFNLLKDTSVNTDFISFSPSSFTATLKELTSLYTVANKQNEIASDKIFTVISSGVKMQAEKDNKTSWINALIDSFRIRIAEPKRRVEVIDVIDEARLSHLGIVPESKRFTTFLVDIGSGNTKGGYFPDENTKNLKLFQLTWGTKSIANAVEKRCEGDLSIANFNKQLYRVLAGSPNTEITYAVNVSGAYSMSDNIAFSGGIAWSVATLLFPEMIDNPVVPVTYNEVQKFSEKLAKNAAEFSDEFIVKNITDVTLDKAAIGTEVKKVNKVFDQKALLAGTGLLLKIMRQFEGIYEKKQFYLVKNGQVGWISAYVDESIIGK
ncbi:hypothetical protein LK994_04160 [Ferruginibacter lapsinanis]|uniref:hypothetical protein n=1 Tax=Ferruginibacter lapsinanis TaxID=563172 RepID=UPI001E4DB945|nr:hypothetical protein [Ferruginibacter lapsinanis]UEG50665.1 hypothetical protein LK994_04160 [Ferruginibacter lapsinanis]